MATQLSQFSGLYNKGLKPITGLAPIGGNTLANLKTPGLSNVGGAALAGLPNLIQGDIKGAAVQAGFNYAGTAVGRAVGTAVGASATGFLGNFVLPGVGGIIGGLIAGKLFGGKKKSPRVGAENSAKVIQQAMDDSTSYVLSDADKAHLQALKQFSGSLSAARAAINADLPNIHGGGSQSEVQTHYKNLVLINAYERDNPSSPAPGATSSPAPGATMTQPGTPNGPSLSLVAPVGTPAAPETPTLGQRNNADLMRSGAQFIQQRNAGFNEKYSRARVA